MNPWEVPNYYGIGDALEDVMLHFVRERNAQPSIEEIVNVATPFFKRAGIPEIRGPEKEALNSVRPTMWNRIQEKMTIPDYTI